MVRALNAVGLPGDDIHWRLTRGRRDEAITTSYLSGRPPYRLHIGCGLNILPGWLNSDYYPANKDLLHVDAEKSFPFPDETFDFIFSEHMIEHIPYPSAHHMLLECFRVLKPGGTIRISTPDLNFLIALYGEKSNLQLSYIKWSQEKFVPWAPEATDTFVINNFVRDWGHCFVYDEKTLRSAMQNAGFDPVVRCRINESAFPELRGLENENRMPPGFLRLETLTMEGTKNIST